MVPDECVLYLIPCEVRIVGLVGVAVVARWQLDQWLGQKFIAYCTTVRVFVCKNVAGDGGVPSGLPHSSQYMV